MECALHPTHPDYRDRDPLDYRSYLGECDRAYGGTRQATGATAEPWIRRARVPFAPIGRERGGTQRVDQRDGVGTAFLRGQRASRDVSAVGRQLDDQRLAQLCSDGAQHTLQRDRVGADVKARLYIWAGD